MSAMILRQSVAVRVPIRLLSSTGSPVTGVVPADITNGTTATHVSVIKADGTVTDITLTAGVNFFEIGATLAPGLYHILIPVGATAVVGPLQLVVLPTAATFLPTVVTGTVDTLSLNAEIARKCIKNKMAIFESGVNANKMIVYEDDGTTPAFTWDLTDVDGNPGTVNPYGRTPA